MANVSFTANLQRHVACPPAEADGATVGDALRSYFNGHPGVGDYILDEHGAVRKHMTIFVDGLMIRDREKLTDPVSRDTEIYVMQALSGG